MKKEKNNQEQIDFRLGTGVAVGLVVLVGIFGYLLWGREEKVEPSPQVDSAKQQGETEVDIARLVKRLNQAGAVLYGSSTCGHCLHQRKVFGEHFEKIKYVNFPEDRKAFEKAGLLNSPIPLWIIKGEKIVGFKTLAELAELVK